MNIIIYYYYYYYDHNLSKRTLMIAFSKGNHVNNVFETFNNKVFFKQITWYGELSKTMVFYSDKNKNNVLLEEWVIENGKTMLIEQFGTAADLSKHWFEAPKHYLDYEKFLDYQNLFDELPNVKR